MLAIGTGDGPPDLEAAIRLADATPSSTRRWACIRTMPRKPRRRLSRLRELAPHPKVLAIGEIGLDYHYDFSPRDVQRDVFVAQLELAAEAGKPIVIHTREAWDDTLAMLREHWHGGGIMHCFTGGRGSRRAQALDLGFHLSFGGVLTFPKAETVREAARISAGRPPAGGDGLLRIWRRCRIAANATNRPSWWRRRAPGGGARAHAGRHRGGDHREFRATVFASAARVR